MDKVDSNVQHWMYVALVALHFLFVQVKKHRLIASVIALLVLAWLAQRSAWMSSSDNVIKQNILRGTYAGLKNGKSEKATEENNRLSQIIGGTKGSKDKSIVSEDYKAIQAQVSAIENRLSDRISQLAIHVQQKATSEQTEVTQLQGEVRLLVDSAQSVVERISITEEGLSKLKAGEDKLEKHLSKSSDRIAQLDDSVAQLAKDLERVQQILEDLQSKAVQNQGDTSRIRSEVRALQASHKQLESRMFTKDALDQAVAKMLQSNLPSSMPIMAGSVEGQYTIDPDFWRYLKTLILKEVVGDKNFKVPTWDTFVAENTANLENWVDRRVRKIGTSDVEMIDRSVFISEVQKQMNSLREEFMQHLSESRTLANRAVQQAMDAKAGNRRMVDSASSGNASAILDIVQQAFSNLEHDLYKQHNLASFEQGAKIIPEWTSETLRAERHWLFWPKLGFRQLIETSSPVDCLSDTLPDHVCWGFEGNQGQIGIRLKEPSLLRGITVEGCYDARNMQGVSRAAAPMDMELWGVVDAEQADSTEVANFRRQQGLADDANRVQGQLRSSQAGTSADLRMKRDHILFGKFVYDGRYVDVSEVTQTWQVAAQAREFDIPVKAIKLRIETNWGDKEFTCLHRIKIHGLPKADWEENAKVMDIGDDTRDDISRD